MDTPLSAVERIARAEDRWSAIVFFVFFSRYEYALKRAGYIQGRNGVKPDWDEYARCKRAILGQIMEGPADEAVRFLQEVPPKKQVIRNGKLGWEPDSYTGKFDLARLLTLVCRVRNNLFHGGKFQEGPEEDISRDRQLMEASLKVLQACLDTDHGLRSVFLAHLQ